MHLETSSNLYGTTVNPYNRNHTPGGSSGGEGALIGLRGSCLGVGGDIGQYFPCPLPPISLALFFTLLTCKDFMLHLPRISFLPKFPLLSLLGPPSKSLFPSY